MEEVEGRQGQRMLQAVLDPEEIKQLTAHSFIHPTDITICWPVRGVADAGLGSPSLRLCGL